VIGPVATALAGTAAAVNTWYCKTFFKTSSGISSIDSCPIAAKSASKASFVGAKTV